MWNAGICGNVAADVAARFAADVAVRQPTVVAVMLGMNDVNGPDYGPGAQPAALAPALDKALAAWRANLGRVLAQAKAAKAAVILVTPPPYDQDSSVGGPAKTGKNEALALDLVPFAAELGREELVVSGLKPGSYALAIAGSAIGSYTAAELAAGIDLGACTTTPQYRQALAVAALNDRRAELEVGLRNVVFLESEMAKDRVDAQDPAAAQAWLGRLGNWRKGLVPSYQATKPRSAAVLAEVVDLDRQIHAAAQPAAQAYTLTRLP